MAENITIFKQDHNGKPVLFYEGKLLETGHNWICVRAVFQYDDVNLGVVTFRRGDVFTEWFYGDRWYNVFEVHDRDDGRLKGWYCNVTRPALIEDHTIKADDLALDLFVKPNGQVYLLDEEEFSQLDLPLNERLEAMRAVETLRGCIARREPPFSKIKSRR